MNLSGKIDNDSPQPRVGDSSLFRESPAKSLWRAWQESQEEKLESFVAGWPNITLAQLGELVCLDFSARWQRHDRPLAEEYLRRFPAVADDAELAIDLIYTEFLAREQSGERPELAEYEARFPALAQVLSEQIRLHDAFDATLDCEDFSGDALSTDPVAGQFFPSAASGATLTGGYEIIGQVGSGGMGVVYKAEHAALGRIVALKMLRAIDAGNPEMLARIRAEARLVATLHHPHIVQVYDYGEHEGLPYIAMEFVAGGSLADRLDGTPWLPRDAAALLVKLAGAVQFAHERQVIHRDLKPANVLIAAGEGPLEVKITDFGLAKLYMSEATMHTRSFAFLGTPSYMAPEQARGRARDLGPGADIFSLGAILYELLTGQPPFRGESPLETLRLLLSSEPESIQRRASRVPRDLATICDKCLQSDTQRRYPSAADLRDDLERYLDSRPIQARHIGSAERSWRWCRRHRPLALALGSVALLSVGITLVSLWFSARLQRELVQTETSRQAERAANRTAQLRMWDAYLSEAAARNNGRQMGQRFAALQAVDKAIELRETLGPDAKRDQQLRSAVLSSAVLPDLRTARLLDEWPTQTQKVDMAANADCYVASAADGSLSGFRISTGRKQWTIERFDGASTPVLSPDGQLLAAINDQGTTVWRVAGDEPKILWQSGPAEQFAFAPDGQHAAWSNRQHGMRWVRSQDGVVIRAIGKGSARSRFAFHAPSQRLAVCGKDSVQVIRTSNGDVEIELPLGTVFAPQVAWHPSGESLAIWGDVEGISLWDIRSGAATLKLTHRGVPAGLCFTDDGSILASHSLWDRRMLVWDVATGQRILDVPEIVFGASDSAAGRHILFLTKLNGQNVLAELTAGACRTLATAADEPLGAWNRASLSPEGRIAAFSGYSGLELWDIKTARRLLARRIGPCRCQFDDAGRLFVASSAGVFRLSRDVKTNQNTDAPDKSSPAAANPRNFPPQTVVTYAQPARLTGLVEPMSMAVNATGEMLAFQDSQGWAFARPDAADAVRHLATNNDPRISTVSNDNRFIAIANWEAGGAAVWDACSGALLNELSIGRHGFVQFSPNGQLLAATPDGVTVWRTKDWCRASSLNAEGSTPAGLGIEFSPDSRVLAVGQINGVLGLFDPITGKLWASLSSPDSRVASTLAFSPDQRWLIAASFDERSPPQILDLVALRSELASRGLDLPADVLAPADTPSPLAGQLNVILEDDGRFPVPLSDP